MLILWLHQVDDKCAVSHTHVFVDSFHFGKRAFKFNSQEYDTNIQCVYFLSMRASFEKVVIYILKTVLSLNFQTVTPTFDTIFELVKSKQPRKSITSTPFLKSSWSQKLRMLKSNVIKKL